LKIVTATESRELDKRASEEYGVQVSDLMEQAGKALALTLADFSDAEKILVLCGHGNNGGDGLAAAREIKRSGREVTVCLSCDPQQLSMEAMRQYRKVVEDDIHIFSPSEEGYKQALQNISNYDAVIDALLGTGAKPELRDEIKRMVETCRNASLIISADIPTGTDPDTGIAKEPCIHADVTVSFGLPKPCFFQNDGLNTCGDWRVVNIGFPEELLKSAGRAFLLLSDFVFGLLPYRTRGMHKWSSGSLLVVAGSNDYLGSAGLVARGGLRAGAGMVTVASIPRVLENVSHHLSECTLQELEEEDGHISAKSFEKIAKLSERYDVIAIGPGIGRCKDTRELVLRLLNEVETDWVIDADALYYLPEMSEKIKGRAILTPHTGEAAHILDVSSEELAINRFESARNISQKYAQTVLLKGPFSIIAQSGMDLAVNPAGNPILASAGTGDVLTGMAGAYFAMSNDPFSSLVVASFLHGVAADLLVENFPGYMGALASEIADEVPRARKKVVDDLVSLYLDEELDDEFSEEDDEFEEMDN
jgi:hydroxyethylthiazole kinase-like uncharacterized protein yjeF